MYDISFYDGQYEMSSMGVDAFGKIATLPGRMVSGYLLER